MYTEKALNTPYKSISSMGRIKTALTKRVTNELLDRYRKDFKADFESNKLLVSSHADIKSKKIRNTISGYLVRLVKQKQQEKV